MRMIQVPLLLTFLLCSLACQRPEPQRDSVSVKSDAADPYARDRARMVQEQLRASGIREEKVLAAMTRVPRHEFVEPPLRHLAYDDGPLPIGFDQTISQPYIVGYMTEAAKISPEEKVLEIGTGSGYQAAILAERPASMATGEASPTAVLQRAIRY